MSSNTIPAANPPGYIMLRRTLPAMILACALLYCVMASRGARRGGAEVFRLGAELIVFAAAAIMCYKAANKFERGGGTRLTWMLISAGAGLFSVADLGLYLPSVILPSTLADVSLLTAVFAITLSRILLAYGLWTMVKVYRESGLRLRLDRYDAGAMAVFGALNLLTVIFGANTVRLLLANMGGEITKWVLAICWPLPFGLVLCSVLSVIIWRYARQMGGGLVAKGWWGVLLYMVALPVRTVLLGLIPIVLGRGSSLGWIGGPISFLGLAIAGWSLYLGASYQYEACTRELPVEVEYSARVEGEASRIDKVFGPPNPRARKAAGVTHPSPVFSITVISFRIRAGP